MPLDTFRAKACATMLGAALGWFSGIAVGAPGTSLPELPKKRVDSRYVPPTGATIPVRAGGDLQKAIDAARPGDEIVLDAGAEFRGNFVLPMKVSGTGWITIRGARMSALPQPGQRVNPSHAPAMPKIVTPNANPALSTKPGAHHYRIMGVEIAVAPSVSLAYSTVLLGDATQPAEIPTDLIFDRVYIHGTVLCHCKQGIILNSGSTAIVDSYISEYHATNQDTQAILGYNGPGPYLIANNYLEGAGENIMFGGSTAKISGMIPADIEFQRNYLAKPVRWRDSIIPRPKGLTAVPGGGEGLRAGGTYYYAVTALGPGAGLPELQSDPSDEAAVRLQEGQGSASLSWAPASYGGNGDVRAATAYRVYRTADPPSAKTRAWVYFNVPAGPSPSFTDTGEAGTAGPPGLGHRWVVKNLFEIKNAERLLVDSNVMEYSWQHGQLGFAIVALPRTEDGRVPWAVAQDMTFTRNLIRHAGGGAGIGGIDTSCLAVKPASECRQSSRVLIRNNVFEDLSYTNWGGRGWAFQLQNTSSATVDHNTSINTGTYGFAMWLDGKNIDLAVTNNIVNGHIAGGGGAGASVIAKYAVSSVVTRNVLASVDPKWYDPADGNFMPATLAAVRFNNYAAGDFSLAPDSPYKDACGPGCDAGANVAQVKAVTAGVVSGTSRNPARPAIASVLNAASFADDGVAPGSIVSIFGVDLAAMEADANTDSLPRDLGDVTLTINGAPAPLLRVSSGQVDAQVPYETANGRATAVIASAGAASEPFSFVVKTSAPGAYLASPGRALAYNQDGSLNTADNPSPAGTILTVYLTGQGAVEPLLPTGALAPGQPLSRPVLPVSARIGSVAAETMAAVLTPGTAGVFQAHVIVPAVPPGDYTLVIFVGAEASNPATISIC